jgi:GcrA cell cycle regulator
MTVWTEEIVTELKALNAKGLSLTDIGLQLGFTRGAVGGKLHRMGLTEARPPSARRGKHVRLRIENENTPAARSKREAGAAALREQFTAIEIVDLPPDESEVAVPLFKLRPHSCRWPLGDPRDLNAMRFCGADHRDGKPYCERHCRIAYQPSNRSTAA